MTRFLPMFAALLLPLVLLLLLGMRKKRKRVYPHLLFEDSKLPPLIRFLLREWRSIFDLIFDIALAAMVAARLSSFVDPGSGQTALVLDCSYSMRIGNPGERPIDKALSALTREREKIRGSRIFALGADRRSGNPVLLDLTGRLEGNTKEEMLAELERASAFLNISYDPLKALPARGFRKILFYTDSFPYRAEGLGLAESGFQDSPFSYPSAILLDPLMGENLVALTRYRDDSSAEFSKIDPETGRSILIPEGAVRRESSRAHVLFRTWENGLFRVKTGTAEYFLELAEVRMAARAEGELSESLLSLFPFARATESGGVFFRDILTIPKNRDHPRNGVLSYLGGEIDQTKGQSAISKSDLPGESLIPPEKSLGYPIPGGSYADGLFRLSPQSLGNENLPLAYYTEFLSFREGPFLAFPPKGSSFLFGSDSSAVYEVKASGSRAVVCISPEELFAAKNGATFRLKPYARPGFLFALIALAVYAAKIAFFARYGGSAGKRRPSSTLP